MGESFSNYMTAKMRTPDREVLRVPCVKGGYFVGNSSGVVRAELLTVIQVLLPVKVRRGFAVEGEGRLILNVCVVLGGQFVIDFRHFFCGAPTGRIVPTQAFRYRLTEAFFILRVFRSFNFARNGQRYQCVSAYAGLVCCIGNLYYFALIV